MAATKRTVSFTEDIEMGDLELSTDEEDTYDHDLDVDSAGNMGMPALVQMGAKSGSLSQSTANDWSTTVQPGSDEERWLNRLQKLECVRFVPHEADESQCHCGREECEHVVERDVTDRATQWSPTECIVTKKSDAIGKIQFEGDGMQSMFFRLAYLTPKDELIFLLNKVLHMSEYSLYIHFLDFELGDEDIAEQQETALQKSLKTGLRLLSEKTRLVISSMGLKTGVSRHVHRVLIELCEDDLFHSQVFRLACPPWGGLTKEERKRFITEDPTHVIKPGIRKDENAIGENLSSLFSHYLMFDDGMVYANQDKDIAKHAGDFRKRVEKVLGRLTENAVSVYVMINGGPKMLDHIIKVIKRNTPVIIIRRTGGFADKLAKNYLRAEKVLVKEMDETGKFHVRSKLLQACELLDVEEEHVSKVRHILDNNHLLTVFDPHFQSQGLDMVICQALLKGRQEHKLNQLLKTFLTTCNEDTVKKKRMSSCQDCFMGSPSMQMDFLIEAMLNDCSDVVDVILKGKLDLTKHFTTKRLRELYDRKVDAPEFFSPVDVRRVLHNLLGAHYPLRCHGKKCQCLVKKEHKWEMIYNPRMFRTCLPPVQEMFVWALLTNHQKQARVFWAHSQDKLASALVAEVILTRLAEKEDNTDREFKLKENAEEFANLAIEVLRICYEVDEKATHELLMKQSTWWGGLSVMDLAYNFRSRRFISQPACKSFLDRLWIGQMKSVGYLQTVGILLSTIPGLIIVPVLNMTASENDDSQRFSLREENTDQFCSKLRSFYNAPIVKYFMTVALFVLFLLVYSYVLLVDLQPGYTVCQGVLCAWVATYLGEEIRQILSIRGRTVKKLKYYWQEGWNKLDVGVISLFFIGMVLMCVPYDQAYHTRRIILSVDFVLFCMRLLQAFAVGQEVGPMLSMILNMIGDTVTFMKIMFVFILSYAVASESLLFPQSHPQAGMFYSVPRKAYWQIYGDFFLGEIEGTELECTHDVALYTNDTMERCPSEVGTYAVPIMLALYCIITHVLLLNLLIAKFNDTYSRVQGESKIHWAWYRCQIFHEFAVRPSLPPPLNAFSCLWWLVMQMFSLLKKFFTCHFCPQRFKSHCNIPMSCTSGQRLIQEKVRKTIERDTSVDLLWGNIEGVTPTRYRIRCYVIKDNIRGITDINNPDMVITMYAVKFYTINNLLPDTEYQLKIQHQVREDPWVDYVDVDVRTRLKDDVRVEDHEGSCVSQMEKVLVEDAVTSKLDVLTTQTRSQSHDNQQSFQQVKGDLSQLSQKVKQHDQTMEVAIKKQIGEMATKLKESESAIMAAMKSRDREIRQLQTQLKEQAAMMMEIRNAVTK